MKAVAHNSQSSLYKLYIIYFGKVSLTFGCSCHLSFYLYVFLFHYGGARHKSVIIGINDEELLSSPPFSFVQFAANFWILQTAQTARPNAL